MLGARCGLFGNGLSTTKVKIGGEKLLAFAAARWNTADAHVLTHSVAANSEK
jgi:hypothetical protein